MKSNQDAYKPQLCEGFDSARYLHACYTNCYHVHEYRGWTHLMQIWKIFRWLHRESIFLFSFLKGTLSINEFLHDLIIYRHWMQYYPARTKRLWTVGKIVKLPDYLIKKKVLSIRRKLVLFTVILLFKIRPPKWI